MPKKKQSQRMKEIHKEITRMKRIMYHFRKLSYPSRDFVLWVQKRHISEDLPEKRTK